MTEFKRGDRVRWADENPPRTIGIVWYVDNVKEVMNVVGIGCWYGNLHFRNAALAEEPSVTIFKPGQHVIIRGGGGSFMGERHDCEGTVEYQTVLGVVVRVKRRNIEAREYFDHVFVPFLENLTLLKTVDAVLYGKDNDS